MKPKYKIGDIIHIRPESLPEPPEDGFGYEREIIYVDEYDPISTYQLDGDDNFRLRWWNDSDFEN